MGNSGWRRKLNVTMRRARAPLAFLFATVLLSATGAQAAVGAPVALGMEVRVPLILRVSVGGSWDAALRLSGYLGARAGGAHSFAVAPLAVVDLGQVRVFSNCEGRYAISILSRGGGFLARDGAAPDAANARAEGRIPYSLILDGVPLQSPSGVYAFDMAGKSIGGGTLLDLKLVFPDLGEGLPQGLYDDTLIFSIAPR